MKHLSLLFITLILQVIQAFAIATFKHINALCDICKITTKIKQVFVFNSTKSVKWIFHKLLGEERLTSCKLDIKLFLIPIERY